MSGLKTIEGWRAAKARLDQNEDLRDLLGCVGEPLYDVLREHLLALPTAQADHLYVVLTRAAKESRDRLAGLIQEHAQDRVDDALADLTGYAEGHCVDFDSESFAGTTTLQDIAQKGADDLYCEISGWEYHVEKPERWGL